MQHRWESCWFCAQAHTIFPNFMWWLNSLETWNASPTWSYYRRISLKSPNQLTSASISIICKQFVVLKCRPRVTSRSDWIPIPNTLLFWNQIQAYGQQCERSHIVQMSFVRVQLKHQDLRLMNGAKARRRSSQLLKFTTSQQPTCPVPELDTYLFFSEHNQGLASVLQNYSLSFWKIKFLLLLQSYCD